MKSSRSGDLDQMGSGIIAQPFQRLKSRQMRLGEEAERVAGGVVMDDLGVRVGEEVELAVSG